ncbi:MAG: carbonic anhydrase [Thermacetogeniaceae bacterium]
MSHGSFATAINCMDGRVQLPVITYLRERHGVDYVDVITEPGPIKALSERSDQTVLESIRRRLEISVVKHRSQHVAVVGHHDCAGNPVGKDVQLKQIAAAVETVKSWGFDCEVTGLWVDEDWNVHEV